MHILLILRKPRKSVHLSEYCECRQVDDLGIAARRILRRLKKANRVTARDVENITVGEIQIASSSQNIAAIADNSPLHTALQQADFIVQIGHNINHSSLPNAIKGVTISAAAPGALLNNQIKFSSISEAATTKPNSDDVEPQRHQAIASDYHYAQFEPSEFVTSLHGGNAQQKRVILVLAACAVSQADTLIQKCIDHEPNDARIWVMTTSDESAQVVQSSHCVAGINKQNPDKIVCFGWRDHHEILSLLRLSHCGYFAGTELYQDAKSIGLPSILLDLPDEKHLPKESTTCANRFADFEAELLQYLKLNKSNMTAKARSQGQHDIVSARVIKFPDQMGQSQLHRLFFTQVANCRRKLRKLRQSPKHFFIDSHLFAWYRNRTIH